jgi:hypothetical protein
MLSLLSLFDFRGILSVSDGWLLCMQGGQVQSRDRGDAYQAAAG